MARTKRSAATAAALLISASASAASSGAGSVADHGNGGSDGDHDPTRQEEPDEEEDENATPPRSKRSRRQAPATSSKPRSRASAAKSTRQAGVKAEFEPDGIDEDIPTPAGSCLVEAHEVVDLSEAPKFPFCDHAVVASQDDVTRPAIEVDAFLFDEIVESATYIPFPPNLTDLVDPDTSIYSGPSTAVVVELSKCLIQPVLLVDRPIINPHRCMYEYDEVITTSYQDPNYEAAEDLLDPTSDELSTQSLTWSSFCEVESWSEYARMSARLQQYHPHERVTRQSGTVSPWQPTKKCITLRTVWVVPVSGPGEQERTAKVTVPNLDSPLRNAIRPSVMKYLRVAVHPLTGSEYATNHASSGGNGDVTMFKYRWSVYLRLDQVHSDLVGSGSSAAKEVIRALLASISDKCAWTSTLSAMLDQRVCRIPSVLGTEAPELAAGLDHMVFDDEHREPAQVACASWLIQQEQANPRSISVIPSNTRIRTKLVRLGTDGFLFDPLTHLIHRPDPFPHAPADPIPSTTISCTDLLIKPPAGATSSVILPILALVRANQLVHARPLPSHFVPSRATLVVCHPLALIEWELAARRIFPKPGQVIVIDSQADFQRSTLHQVLAADLVLVSDVFLVTDYDHHLLKVADLIGHSRLCSHRQYVWCENASKKYLNRQEAIWYTGGRHSRHVPPLVLTASEVNDMEFSGFAADVYDHIDVHDFRFDFEANQKIRNMNHGVPSRDRAEVHARATDYQRRHGHFHVPIQEQMVERNRRVLSAASPELPDGTCPLLHLIHWHRIVFDGPTRATQRRHVLERLGIGKDALFKKGTPFRELCSSSTVTVLHSDSGSIPEHAINVKAAHLALNIDPNDKPDLTLPVRAKHDLLAQIGVYMPQPEIPTSHDFVHVPQPPSTVSETIPVYLSGPEALFAALASAMAHDSVPMTVASIQHHLVTFSRSPAALNSAFPKRSDMAYVYQAADRIHSGSCERWTQLNQLAVYRRARGRDLFQGLLYVDDDCIDGWRAHADMNQDDHGRLERDVVAEMDGDVFAGNPGKTEERFMKDARLLLSESPNKALRLLVPNKVEWQNQREHMLTQVKLFMQGHLERLQDAGEDLMPKRSIAKALFERGFTGADIKDLLGVVPAQVYEGVGADKSQRRAALRKVHSSYDANEAPPPLKDESKLKRWYMLLIALVRCARLYYGASRSQALVQQVKQWVAEWKSAGSLVRKCVSTSHTASRDDKMFTCKRCRRHLKSAQDAVVYFACGASGCSKCMRSSHPSNCSKCIEIDDSLPAPIRFKYHPLARHRVEQEWSRVLDAFDLSDRVETHARVLEWVRQNPEGLDQNALENAGVMQEEPEDGSRHSSSRFTHMFGVKVQAIAMYILQQLEVDPAAKFVVLSEYLSQQHLLGLALDLLKVRTELVLHAASEYSPIRAFKTDPSVRVLIVPFTKCVPGRVDLTEATHVLLAHPFVGPSPELYVKKYDDKFLSPTVSTDERIAQEARDLEGWRRVEEQCVKCVVGVAGKVDDERQEVKVVRFVIHETKEAELV